MKIIDDIMSEQSKAVEWLPEAAKADGLEETESGSLKNAPAEMCCRLD